MCDLLLLSTDERAAFHRDGFILVKQALSTTEVARLRAAAERLIATLATLPEEEKALVADDSGRRGDWAIPQLFAHSAEFDALIDAPRAFARVLALMGPYLQLGGFELFARGALRSGRPLDFHTDGGAALARHRMAPDAPILQLKVHYFLTDLSQPRSGNMSVVPGSHVRRAPQAGADFEREAVDVLADAGDALVFPWSLWHAVSPNESAQVRISVMSRYLPMWCRPVDYTRADERVLARMSGRQQRLLGDLGDLARPADYYAPPRDQWSLMFAGEWAQSPEAALHRRGPIDHV